MHCHGVKDSNGGGTNNQQLTKSSDGNGNRNGDDDNNYDDNGNKGAAVAAEARRKQLGKSAALAMAASLATEAATWQERGIRGGGQLGNGGGMARVLRWRRRSA